MIRYIVRLRAEWRDRVGIDTLFVYNPGNLPALAQNTLLTIIGAPPRIASTSPGFLETSITGEPTKDDTLSIIGTDMFAVNRVLWNDTLQLRTISQSVTRIQVFIPDSLHRRIGSVALLLITEDSLSTRGFITLAYPKPEIIRIRPDTIELAGLSTLLAYKTDGELSSSHNRNGESPVYAGLPTSIELYPNAPNPFDRQTTIEYAVPEETTLAIEIYDPLGRKVADLVPRKLHKAGFYAVQWSAENHTASGVYTAVLQSVDAKGKITRKTLRMTLIR